MEKGHYLVLVFLFIWIWKNKFRKLLSWLAFRFGLVLLMISCSCLAPLQNKKNLCKFLIIMEDIQCESRWIRLRTHQCCRSLVPGSFRIRECSRHWRDTGLWGTLNPIKLVIILCLRIMKLWDPENGRSVIARAVETGLTKDMCA